jgi:asparagine synthase (glutamine-hydrolysing)
MRLPASTKLGNLGDVVRINENEPGPKTEKFFDKTHDGKLILRRVMKRYVPDKITTAVKKGFSAPDASWFRGESIDYVRDILYDPRLQLYDYLDRRSTLELVNEHFEGKVNRRLLIWSLLSVAEWLDTFCSARR